MHINLEWAIWSRSRLRRLSSLAGVLALMARSREWSPRQPCLVTPATSAVATPASQARNVATAATQVAMKPQTLFPSIDSTVSTVLDNANGKGKSGAGPASGIPNSELPSWDQFSSGIGSGGLSSGVPSPNVNTGIGSQWTNLAPGYHGADSPDLGGFGIPSPGANFASRLIDSKLGPVDATGDGCRGAFEYGLGTLSGLPPVLAAR